MTNKRYIHGKSNRVSKQSSKNGSQKSSKNSKTVKEEFSFVKDSPIPGEEGSFELMQ